MHVHIQRLVHLRLRYADCPMIPETRACGPTVQDTRPKRQAERHSSLYGRAPQTSTRGACHTGLAHLWLVRARLLPVMQHAHNALARGHQHAPQSRAQHQVGHAHKSNQRTAARPRRCKHGVSEIALCSRTLRLSHTFDQAAAALLLGLCVLLPVELHGRQDHGLASIGTLPLRCCGMADAHHTLVHWQPLPLHKPYGSTLA